MRGKTFSRRTAKAPEARCYETTVDFHFMRNEDGLLIAVDNATGRQIGQIVTMGDTIAAKKSFGRLFGRGNKFTRCVSTV